MYIPATLTGLSDQLTAHYLEQPYSRKQVDNLSRKIFGDELEQYLVSNKVEIKYNHAICFILMHNDYKAFKKLNKILKKYPDYKPAEELLYKLDTCNGLDEFIEEYKIEFHIIDTNNIQDNNDKNDNEQKTENNDKTTK